MSDHITNPENVTASAGRDDAITANASPRPWKAIREIGPDEKLHAVFIADANTIPVARIWPENAADAALIVEAVNERERLRDLVKRMAAYIQVGAIGGALLREARAAIGEGVANG